MEQMLRAEYLKYRNQGGTMPYEQFKILVMKQAQQGQTPNQMMAAGGRAGFENGELVEQQTDLNRYGWSRRRKFHRDDSCRRFKNNSSGGEQLEALAMEIFQLPLEELDEERITGGIPRGHARTAYGRSRSRGRRSVRSSRWKNGIMQEGRMA